jgi:hypothetical protein
MRENAMRLNAAVSCRGLDSCLLASAVCQSIAGIDSLLPPPFCLNT